MLCESSTSDFYPSVVMKVLLVVAVPLVASSVLAVGDELLPLVPNALAGGLIVLLFTFGQAPFQYPTCP